MKKPTLRRKQRPQPDYHHVKLATNESEYGSDPDLFAIQPSHDTAKSIILRLSAALALAVAAILYVTYPASRDGWITDVETIVTMGLCIASGILVLSVAKTGVSSMWHRARDAWRERLARASALAQACRRMDTETDKNEGR